jgi:Na+/proline symporter
VAVLTPIDWAVLVIYMVAIVGFGLWMGRGNTRIEDFFLADRKMRWWGAGLSVMATQISAITFVGTTGQAYTKGMSFLVFYFGLPFAMVILCATLVPFFYRARVFTAYQYLEKRFDARTRTLTSFLFLLSRGLAVGVTLYAPSVVFSVILGWSETSTVLLMGGSTIAYVVYGGNKSVMWTDVVQMGIIWFGIFVCVAVAIVKLPGGLGVRDGLAVASLSGHLDIIDTSFDLSKPYTLWSGLIGGLFLSLAYFGCDQSQVQRYLSGSSLTQSRLALLFNAFLKVPMQFLILLTGVLVFVFFHFHRPPLVWNAVEMRKLEERAPAGELRQVKARFEAAQQARQAAAETYARERRGEGAEDARRLYLAAHHDVEEAQAEANRLLTDINGGRPYNDTNYVFPSYVVSQLPGGLAGLVIAVIFAAAMSALSGELNSLATASMVDFYQRFVKTSATDRHYLAASRVFTAFWGGFACLVAMQAGRLGSAIEVVNRFGSYFYGSILGVFALAVLTPRASARGAFYGLLAGMTAVFLVSRYTSVAFLWFNVVGAATVFAIGLAITALGPPAPAPGARTA